MTTTDDLKLLEKVLSKWRTYDIAYVEFEGHDKETREGINQIVVPIGALNEMELEARTDALEHSTAYDEGYNAGMAQEQRLHKLKEEEIRAEERKQHSWCEEHKKIEIWCRDCDAEYIAFGKKEESTRIVEVLEAFDMELKEKQLNYSGNGRMFIRQAIAAIKKLKNVKT